MKNKQKLNLALSLMAAGTLLCSCGVKQVTQNNVPTTTNPTDQPFNGKIVQYRVRRHDTLWGIAGKSLAYGDPFEWPLIFKANRDIISDPDLIYPKQNFKIEKGLSAEVMAEAKKLAEETPKYVPHEMARTKLPIDYF